MSYMSVGENHPCAATVQDQGPKKKLLVLDGSHYEAEQFISKAEGRYTESVFTSWLKGSNKMSVSTHQKSLKTGEGSSFTCADVMAAGVEQTLWQRWCNARVVQQVQHTWAKLGYLYSDLVK